MKTIKQAIFFLLILTIVYLGIINRIFPVALIIVYLLFGILLFKWLLRPYLISDDLKSYLRKIDFHDYTKVIVFLILTILAIKGMFDVKIVKETLEMNILFWVLKIGDTIMLLLILIITLIYENYDGSNM